MMYTERATYCSAISGQSPNRLSVVHEGPKVVNTFLQSLLASVIRSRSAQRGFLRIPIAVVFAFFHLALVATAEESFSANGSTVVFTSPDRAQWDLVQNGLDEKSNKYLLMFKHKPIKDAEGRDIEPVIALISESVPDSLDVIMYSIQKRTQVPFEVKKLITWQDGSFAYRNSVGYEGEYKKGAVLHKVFIGHLRHKGAGVQIICDSTDGAHDKVEADMRNFLRSISFKE
jgi:hypothetical protein